MVTAFFVLCLQLPMAVKRNLNEFESHGEEYGAESFKLYCFPSSKENIEQHIGEYVYI